MTCRFNTTVITAWALAIWMLAAAGARASDPNAASDWELVTEEDGVVVTQRAVPDREFPTFRGTTVIDATPYEILAVIQDVTRHTEWMENCIEARKLEEDGKGQRLGYNRTDLPWPLADRDAVILAQLTIREPDRSLLLEFAASEHPAAKPIRGVVRMPTTNGHYKLESHTPNQTQVEYQVDTDPGGHLPKWLVRRSTKYLPLRTLTGLRAQIEKTRGNYADFIRKLPAPKPPAE